ncbi:MAG TPA: ATP-binding protein [Methylomirabilota bacterium]|nr:ATP-binding protein [Methylomirabilota bacterium]
MDSLSEAEAYAARLAAIVTNAEDAIISKTLEGRITSWNGAAERMFGYTEREVLGQPITIIIPKERLFEEDEIIRRLHLGQSIEHFETERITKDGRLIPIALTVSPIRARDGHVVGASKIARDISAQKRLERERDELRRLEQAALAQARLANQAKDEFLAMLAHELRNPVGVIVNALAVLERPDAVRPQQDRARGMIERQAHHLARLLDDLLDVARLGGRLVDLERVSVDLRTAVEQAVEMERHRLDTKRQRLTVSVPGAPVTVAGDPVRLQQIIGNLLNNARKFTPIDGTIRISLSVEAGTAILVVVDNGPGIPPDKLEAIFDLFAQASPTLARTEGGLGIGLTLVRQLLELHGGSVSASNEPCGGARFTVRLPLAAPEDKMDAPPSAAPPGRAQRVLLVEDNHDARDMQATLLRMLGHEVLEAATGAEGVDAAVRHAPDVVIMDIGLPDIDGYEAARRIRRQRGDTVRLIAVSGYGQPQDRALSHEAGFDAHLVKPVDPAALNEILQGAP